MHPTDPTQPWPVFPISEPGIGFGHGLGTGDINGDGRIDVTQAASWWEQPPSDTTGPWRYHPVAFGRWGPSEGAGGALMAVYDVNGDTLNDVVTGLNAHGFGLAWFEQKRAARGAISFVRHMIMDDYSTRNAASITMSAAPSSSSESRRRRARAQVMASPPDAGFVDLGTPGRRVSPDLQNSCDELLHNASKALAINDRNGVHFDQIVGG